jgi:hypothetical protein
VLGTSPAFAEIPHRCAAMLVPRYKAAVLRLFCPINPFSREQSTSTEKCYWAQNNYADWRRFVTCFIRSKMWVQPDVWVPGALRPR